MGIRNQFQGAVIQLNWSGCRAGFLSLTGSGIWEWRNNTTWQYLNPLEALHLAVGAIDGGGTKDLIIDFVGYGLWSFRNHTTWNQLHPSNVTALTRCSIRLRLLRWRRVESTDGATS